VKRYYIGVDWGDRLHQVYVGDQDGKKVREVKVDCAPPVGEFSPRFEGGATGSFGFLNLHLVFLRG
jgi:hypothetical protein